MIETEQPIVSEVLTERKQELEKKIEEFNAKYPSPEFMTRDDHEDFIEMLAELESVNKMLGYK